MQNNSLSLLGALCLSTTFFINPVFAQNSGVQTQPIAQESNPTINVSNSPKPTTDLVSKTDMPQPLSGDLISEKEKKLSEVTVPTTQVTSDRIIDFPGRSSLGSMEMTTLPGLNETLITGPAPMGESLSTKDLPSERLLGRITSEVFQEMADLERGNVFLKLQMQKEQLKNDLEKLKATYRQTRLEEIAKREDVVRSRINWWQEQENIRLETERKKAETESIEQQIAEAEELRNKLRAEAISEKENIQKNEPSDPNNIAFGVEALQKNQLSGESDENSIKTNVPFQRASELYTLLGIRGIKNHLSARLKNNENGSIITVKEHQRLSTGHKIKKIQKDSIIISLSGNDEVIVFTTVNSNTENNRNNNTTIQGE